MQYLCLVGCNIPLEDVAVCLVLTIEVYAYTLPIYSYICVTHVPKDSSLKKITNFACESEEEEEEEEEEEAAFFPISNEFETSKDNYLGGSPGLVVMGDNSCLRGCGFESRRVYWMDIFLH